MEALNIEMDISRIIEMRKPLVERVAKVEENLRGLDKSVRDLDKFRDKVAREIGDDPNAIRCLSEISLVSIQTKIAEALVKARKLRERFSRNTLNIAVVGRAQVGKSYLLRSITGLDESILPSGTGEHCTAVKSLILHNPNAIEASGKIRFHSESTFLNDVISSYYSDLGLGVKPDSLDVFSDSPIPNLPESDLRDDTKRIRHDDLKKYQANLDKYRHRLEGNLEAVSANEIRKYVTQDQDDDSFTYLAVKDVQISCKFIEGNVARLGLIDLPGLGNSTLGDKSRMLETLGQEVDFVLFVQAVTGAIPLDDKFIELYTTAKESLHELPINEWSFLVLNCYNPDPNTERYADTFIKSLAKNKLEFVSTVKVKNLNEEVSELVLEPMLNYLVQHIQILDNKYANSYRSSLLELQKLISVEIIKAKFLFKKSVQNKSEIKLFDTSFEELWKELTNGFQHPDDGLLTKLEKVRNSTDDVFREQVEKVLEECNNINIPTIKEIDSMMAPKEASYSNVYTELLNLVRANLSLKFLSLDDALKESIENVKIQVVDIFLSRGKLSKIYAERDTGFLTKMSLEMSEELAQLGYGFKMLSDFELSYRGLIQHRIRNNLDKLTPNVAPALPMGEKGISQADLIQELLTSSLKEVIYNCKKSLQNIYREPNQAAFAIVEEFVDRVFRATEGEVLSTKIEWRSFYYEIRSEIWDQFDNSPYADRKSKDLS